MATKTETAQAQKPVAEKEYEIYIPKDPYDKSKKQTIYVAVNGVGYYFDRGTTHKVSKPYYEVIKNSFADMAEVEKKYEEVSDIKVN